MTDQSPIQTTNAGLLATFYGPRGELNGLCEWLEQGLGVRRGEFSAVDRSLRELNLIAAQDTSAIQVTLRGSGLSAEQGWPSFCQRLSRILDKEEKVAAIWGYTLVYAAVSEETNLSHESKKEALQQLFAHARPLHSQPVSQVEGLAYSEVAGGHLWLTHLPLKEEGFGAATIYIALAPAANQATLAQQVLWGANAQLLMPDLIAHKGYRERRQYYREGDSDLKHRYEAAADQILNKMGNLLAQPASQAQIASQLEALTQEYSAFLPIVPLLKQLHVSIQRQQHNFVHWKPENEANSTHPAELRQLLDLHHSHLNTTQVDLELLIAKGEETQQVTQIAIDFVQTRLNGARENRQQQIESLLALIGTALAVPQILDRELISALISLFTSALTGIGTAEQTLLLGGIQLLVTIIFALVVWMILKRSR